MSLKKQNSHPTSAIKRYPKIIIDLETNTMIEPDVFNEYCRNVFETIKNVQQEMIEINVDILPERKNSAFGAEWARKNVKLVPAPKSYSIWSKVDVINQSEVARIIFSYRERERIADNLDKLGWDITYNAYKKQTGDKYLKRQLFENVKRHGKHFDVSFIKTARLTYEKVNGSLCRMNVYNDSIIIEFALGEKRFACWFNTKDIAIRYENITHISRPTLLGTDTPQFLFSIEEHKEKPSNTFCVVSFDRNMDTTKPISGVRVYPDGNLSKELSWSIDTQHHIEKAKKLKIELERCKNKKKNLMPYTDSTRLDEQIARLEGKIHRIQNAIDFSLAADIDKHTTEDDKILLERLDWSGGGFIKFRHGSSDERIVHRLNRSGKDYKFVSPKNTSCTCPDCGRHIDNIGLNDRTITCPKCRLVYCRDNGAAINMAQNELKDECKINYNTNSRPVKPFGSRPPKRAVRKEVDGVSCLVDAVTGEILKVLDSRIHYDVSAGTLYKGSVPSKSRYRQAIQLITDENGLTACYDYYFNYQKTTTNIKE